MTGRYRAYPEYKDSGVVWLGEVPSHWNYKRIGFLFTRKKDTGHPDSELLSVYRDHGVIPKNSRDDNWNKPSEDLAPYQLVKVGDLVMNKMKTWQGSIAVSEFEGIVSPAYYVAEPVRGFHKSGHPRYLHYLLRSPAYISQYGRLSKGIRVNQWDLDYEVFKTIETLLPSIDEQAQIAAFLDHETAKIDRLIAKQEELIALLKEKRQAVISHVVTKGLDPDAPMKDSGVEWLGDIPAHWEVSQLRFHTRWIGGGTPFKDNQSYWDGEIPWVTPKDMKRPRIGESIDSITAQAVAETSVAMIPVESVLIVVRGMILARLVPVALTTQDVTVNQDMKALVPSPAICGQYLHYLLLGAERRLFDMVDNSAHGTKCLRTELLQRLEVPLPPVEEQFDLVRRLEVRLDRLDMLEKKAEAEVNLLHERRTALISAAVTGKIDVREDR